MGNAAQRNPHGVDTLNMNMVLLRLPTRWIILEDQQMRRRRSRVIVIVLGPTRWMKKQQDPIPMDIQSKLTRVHRAAARSGKLKYQLDRQDTDHQDLVAIHLEV